MSVVKSIHHVATRFLKSLLLRQSFDEFSCFSDHVSAIGFSSSFDALLCLWPHELFVVMGSTGLLKMKENHDFEGFIF
jgi:hypothetical protein